MEDRITRRALLASASVVVAGCAQSPPHRNKNLPESGETSRYYDPATEAVVTRLTSQAGNSALPFPWQHFISIKNKFLLFASDRARDNKFCPYLLDLTTGVPRQLAEAAAMQPRSMWLESGERVGYFLDGDTLSELNLATRRVRTFADGIAGFACGPGRGEVVVVSGTMLRSLPGRQVIANDASRLFTIAPSGKYCLFNRGTAAEGDELWVAPLSTLGGSKAHRVAQGRISFPFWSADSQSICFLREVEGDSRMLSEIRTVAVDGSGEQTIAATSQFAAFAPNANGSVFVGASRSRAQPDIMLLVRAVRRELTVCEHRASSAEPVLPVFSPDSRRVFYESDREGKSALYSIDVQQLVESTS